MLGRGNSQLSRVKAQNSNLPRDVRSGQPDRSNKRAARSVLALDLMLVRIDTKNWRGNYNSHVVRFNSEQHLSNYLRVCYRDESTSKVIGHEILERD